MQRTTLSSPSDWAGPSKRPLTAAPMPAPLTRSLSNEVWRMLRASSYSKRRRSSDDEETASTASVSSRDSDGSSIVEASEAYPRAPLTDSLFRLKTMLWPFVHGRGHKGRARFLAACTVLSVLWFFLFLPASQQVSAVRALKASVRIPPPAAVPTLAVNPTVPTTQRPFHEHKLINGYLVADIHNTVHPVETIMDLAADAWKTKVSRQSQTLEQAVAEYRRRYFQAPPKGFDRWWAYVQEHEVALPDEYDRINKDLQPFRALKRAGKLSAHLSEASKMKQTFVMEVKDGQASIAKESELAPGDLSRRENQLHLIEPIMQYLPDMKMVFSTSDSPRIMLTKQQQDEINRCMDEEDCSFEHDGRVSGLRWTCPFSSPAHSRKPIPPRANTTLIFDYTSSMNICEEPEAFKLHAFAANTEVSQATKLLPLFSISKTAKNSDILAVPYERWMQEDLPHSAWPEKTGHKLFWRGGATGSHWSDRYEWRAGQRQRLVKHGKAAGQAQLAVWGQDGLTHHSVDQSAAADQLLDMNFVGKAIQCDRHVCTAMEKEYDFVEKVSHRQVIDSRYIMDVDGNAWSSRFKRMLASGSTIFKSSIFPEWYSERIQPWYHFVPVKMDYSELLDTVAFFEGMADTPLHGRHDLAQQIAEHGREYSQTAFRFEDMVAYAFRLYLEWGRLYAPAGVDMDFRL